MANPETKNAWDRFQVDIKGLGDQLRRHYEDAGDEKKTAELNRSLEQLKQAADSLFKSLETATRDPEVKSQTKQAARSFGTAVTETFRELSDELEKALRRPASKP